LNFVPPLFLVYLLGLPLWLHWLAGLALVPIALYGAAVCLQAAVLASSGNAWRSFAAIPFIVLTHLVYGFGFWRGLFTRLPPPGRESGSGVVLETVTTGKV
jgi:hypothetical protein